MLLIFLGLDQFISPFIEDILLRFYFQSSFRFKRLSLLTFLCMSTLLILFFWGFHYLGKKFVGNSSQHNEQPNELNHRFLMVE